MSKSDIDKVAAIVQDAGGSIVGRTKLQKISFILEAAGLGDGFAFEYHHYGPFSEELATAAKDAATLGVVEEKEQRATWGGFYSRYEVKTDPGRDADSVRARIAQEGARANSIELELAATALFLAKEGDKDPWGETARRKPEKAEGGRLERAQEFYRKLQRFETPQPLPIIA